MFRISARDGNAFAGNRTRDQKRSRLDAIGNHGVFGPMQFLYAFDNQTACAESFDLCAHLVQEICKVANFGFRSRTFNHRRSFREHRRHHHVVRAENRRAKFPAQIDHGAAQFRRKDFYVSAVQTYRRAERFESFKMEIDRPIADDTSARHRNRRLLATTEQRAKHTNRGAHLAHHIVGRDGIDFSAVTVTVPLARSTSAPRCVKICTM